MNSRRELEAQLHDKETQKMEEFRSKVNLYVKCYYYYYYYYYRNRTRGTQKESKKGKKKQIKV